MAQCLSWAHSSLPKDCPMRSFNVLPVTIYTNEHVDRQRKIEVNTQGSSGSHVGLRGYSPKDEEECSRITLPAPHHHAEMTINSILGRSWLIAVLCSTLWSGETKMTDPFQEAVQKKISLERLDQCFCEVCISNITASQVLLLSILPLTSVFTSSHCCVTYINVV